MNKENKIKVAQVIGITCEGGVESVVMNYYKNIDRSKVTFDFLVEAESKITSKEIVESLGGHIIIIPSYKKPIKYIRTLRKIFKENKYDIVHSNMNTLSVFSLLAAKQAKIKVRIVHSHSTSNKKEVLKNMIKNMLRPFSKMFATDYFACSEASGRYLFGNKTYDKGLVTIINNGIEVEKFKYNKEYNISLRKELNIPLNAKVIGHVGRFVPQKNHEYLLEIFKAIHEKNKNTKLLLLGDGPLKEEIEAKVHSLGLTESVIFAGTKADVYKYYSVMNLFILPSLYEGLPVVGVEAQASGLGCIFSDNITKEVKIIDNTILMSIDNEIEKWATIALTMMNNCIDRIEINKKFKNSMYDIKNNASKLLEYYEKRLNNF